MQSKVIIFVYFPFAFRPNLSFISLIVFQIFFLSFSFSKFEPLKCWSVIENKNSIRHQESSKGAENRIHLMQCSQKLRAEKCTTKNLTRNNLKNRIITVRSATNRIEFVCLFYATFTERLSSQCDAFRNLNHRNSTEQASNDESRE